MKYYIKSQRANELGTMGVFTHYISLWFPIMSNSYLYSWDPKQTLNTDILFDKSLETLRLFKEIKDKKLLSKTNKDE